MAKQTYEDRFSGSTKAILINLTRIFLDMDLDVRSKHMFGHKAFLIHGRPFLLVGEWARDEQPDEGIVCIADRGVEQSTVIVIPPDEKLAQKIRKKYGGLYFAPSGTRLKSWVSLTGSFLSEETKMLPLVTILVELYAAMPVKEVANPGRRV